MFERKFSMQYVIVFVLLLLSSGFSVCRADSSRTVNLVANPGFDYWSAAANLGTPAPRTDASYLPTMWNAAPETTASPNDPKMYTGGIFMDAEVMHSGRASVRLESWRTSDIIAISQTLPVDPSSKYLISVWYKGDNIQTDGDAGVFVWADYGPTQDYWKHKTFNYNKPSVFEGTFDWRECSFTVDTNATASQMAISLQLRHATGRLWYDDIQVVKLGR